MFKINSEDKFFDRWNEQVGDLHNLTTSDWFKIGR